MQGLRKFDADIMQVNNIRERQNEKYDYFDKEEMKFNMKSKTNSWLKKIVLVFAIVLAMFILLNQHL